jgi:transcriptional regulator with XRE-family HTH domain
MSRPKNITPFPVYALRTALGLSQQQLAAQNDWSASIVQKWERGEKFPSPANIQKLKEIARKNHLTELAATPSPSRRARKKSPAEQPASASKGGNQQQWHDLLDHILNSGAPDEIQAVQSNLRVFGRYAEQKSPMRKHTAPEDVGENTT